MIPNGKEVKLFTHVRIKKTDYLRITEYVEQLKKKNRIGRFAQHDIITASLDAYEEKINKTNEKSMSNV